MDIKGYKKVPYKDMQKELKKKHDDSGKSLVDIAATINVNSTNTIKFAIDNPNEQMVSDKVLTSVFDALGLPGFVMWISGERQYFIKNK